MMMMMMSRPIVSILLTVNVMLLWRRKRLEHSVFVGIP